MLVHNDFTETYGEALIRSVVTGQPHTQSFGMVQAMRKDPTVTEELLRSSRIILVNTWRDLALVDRRSVFRESLRSRRRKHRSIHSIPRHCRISTTEEVYPVPMSRVTRSCRPSGLLTKSICNVVLVGNRGAFRRRDRAGAQASQFGSRAHRLTRCTTRSISSRGSRPSSSMQSQSFDRGVLWVDWVDGI